MHVHVGCERPTWRYTIDHHQPLPTRGLACVQHQARIHVNLSLVPDDIPRKVCVVNTIPDFAPLGRTYAYYSFHQADAKRAVE